MPFGIVRLAMATAIANSTGREEMADEAVPWGHWIADSNMAAPEDDRRHSTLASTLWNNGLGVRLRPRSSG